MLPLQDITVVSIEQAVAAPFATRQLADLGARVIKIERPGSGDFARDYDDTVKGLSSYFAWLNRSKESITLDLKQPAAAEILTSLLATADVFVHNLAPGAVDRLGFGAAELRADNPRLVVGELTGYGSDGPLQSKKAYDLLIQCETGVLSVTGTPEQPAKVGISVADISGGMYLYSAVLAALLTRERTGEGAHCEVSLFDSLSEWMGHPMYYGMYSGRTLPRSGTSHASIAPYGGHRSGDGGIVQFGIQNDREWRRFCREVLGAPELADDPTFVTNDKRVEHRRELTERIEEAWATRTADDVVALLDAAHIANARQRDVAELLTHPQHEARGRRVQVGSPFGAIDALLPPVRMSGATTRMDPIPAVGEHTDLVLRELGRDDAEIDRLRRDGAI